MPARPQLLDINFNCQHLKTNNTYKERSCRVHLLRETWSACLFVLLLIRNQMIKQSEVCKKSLSSYQKFIASRVSASWWKLEAFNLQISDDHRMLPPIEYKK